MPTPASVTVRMYNVGFGDCFLVSAEYDRELDDGRRHRHVLIDAGSTRLAHNADMADVVDAITTHCGGHLDVIVVSHRHKDHLSAFGVKATGDALEKLSPRLVVRPWTEDPAAAPDAIAPRLVGDRSLQFAAGIDEAQRFAEVVATALRTRTGLRGELAAFAEDQIANAAAVARLEAMAADGAGEYLSSGQRSQIEDVVPGVKVRVLGPPTVEEWPEVAQQRADDPEYWFRMRSAVATALEEVGVAARAADDAAAGLAVADDEAVRWLVARMQDRQMASLLRIVRTLDDALNNTSLILLLDFGTRRLLFSGDAQIENWMYALRHAPRAGVNRRLLSRVDLYKVGHHGSRNGTPRSLVEPWSGSEPQNRLALLSTLPGVHGHSHATAVPRGPLLTALARVARLERTDANGAGWTEAHASARTTEPFDVSTHAFD